MEVGAVKQAFNNEVIHLKKNLNQAKIQIIHKLTRKAKTINQKKLPEKLREKLKRKADSAINEVLLIKKIKCKDIAKFAVTHNEDLQKYLNRPVVDNDKACARLLLHKSLQDKYKFIRTSFSNISINDLLMSREERRKIKKELKEQKKDNKNSSKNNMQEVSDDESDVEDLLAKIKNRPKVTEEDDSDAHVSDVDNDMNAEQSIASDDDHIDKVSDEDNADDDYDVEGNSYNANVDDNNDLSSGQSDDNVPNNDREVFKDNESIGVDDIGETNDSSDNTVGKFVKAIPTTDDKKSVVKPPKEDLRKKLPKKHKDINKQKFSEKIKKKRQKNDKIDEPQGIKVVDPFFKTVSGDNYMSLAEPRAPDEIKEVHRQGNRKLRRAVMFGYAPKSRLRQNLEEDRFGSNVRHNKKTGNYNDTSKLHKEFNGDKNNKTDFNSNGFSNDKRFNNKRSFDNEAVEKPEKLHPSWEAKKRISSILPFQGKKIVFDDS